jgi:hypothetical protein
MRLRDLPAQIALTVVGIVVIAEFAVSLWRKSG